MLNDKTFLAVIPARGGSKRLPRKNVLNLAGKPLITWTIEASLNSKYIDKVVVTSDDHEILEISKDNGVDVLRRPSELASDTATTFDVIKHAIDNFEQYHYVVLLQPTSPLRTQIHIDKAIQQLVSQKADAVVSVCETGHSPFWSNTLPDDGSMIGFIDDNIKNLRSQDLQKHYRLNGAIYICDTKRLLIEECFFIKNNIFSYIMNRNESIDIDEKQDFEFCNYLLREKKMEVES